MNTKRILPLVAACAVAGAAAFGVTVNDGVMTITEAGKISELLTPAEIALLTGNSVTNVLLAIPGAPTLTSSYSTTDPKLQLDVDLTGYTGGWTSTGGGFSVARATGAFGSGTGEAATVLLKTSSAQLFIPLGMEATVSNPVRLQANNGSWKAVYINNLDTKTATSITLNGKLTIENNCNFHFQGGKAKLVCNGGLEQLAGTVSTTGANGHWQVKEVPCKIKQLQFSWIHLDLYVAGNEIETLNFNNAGGKLNLYADEALSGYPTVFRNLGSSCEVALNGHSARIGRPGDWTSSGVLSSNSGAATLTVSNDTAATIPIAFSGSLSLKKIGSETLTLSGGITAAGSLEAAEGTVELTGTWKSCTGVTLSGGTFRQTTSGALGTGSVTITATGAAPAGCLQFADGVSQSASAFTNAGENLGAGLFGGAASAAERKLDLFSPTLTGLLSVERILTVTIPSGTTKTNLSTVVSADDFEKVNMNGYTRIVKKGEGKLVLAEELAFRGNWSINAGTIHVTAPVNGLGVAGVAGYDGVDVYTWSGGTLNVGVAGQTTYVDKPITLVNDASQKFNTWGKVHLTRLFTLAGNNIIIYGGSTVGALYTEGGVSNPTGTLADNAANGTWYWYNPVDVSGFHLSWLTLVFEQSSNHVQSVGFGPGCNIKLKVADTFVPAPTINLAGGTNSENKDSGGSLDLNGFNFEAADFRGGCSSVLKNSAARPVTFAFNQTTATTNHKCFVQGNISLLKGGPATYAVNCAQTATGALTVTNGVFAFLANGTWTACTNVTVRGSDAVVALNASTNLADRVECFVAQGGRFDLAAGVEQSVGNLYIDGRPVQRSGTYGGADSNARYKLPSVFTGAGVLDVHSRFGGTSIIVR